MRVLGTAATEWVRFFRDRIAMFSTLALPVVLVLLIGLSFGQSRSALPVGLLASQPGPLGSQLVQTVQQTPGLQVSVYTDRGDMYRDIRMGLIAGGLEVPPDGQVVQIDVQQTSQDAGALISTVNAAAARVGTRAIAVDVLSAQLPPEQARSAVAAAQRSVPEITVTTRAVGEVAEMDANPFASAVPSQLMLFMFLNGLIGAAALVQSRQLGVLRRTRAAPQGLGVFIGGLGLSRFAIAMMQAALLLGLGLVSFRIDLGSPGAWIPLVVLYAIVCAAAGMLLGAVVRTPGQAVALAIPLGIVGGMLGGTMWPLSVVGPVMRAIGHLTPQAWAMDAWNLVINQGAGLGGIATQMAVLTGFAVGFGALALWALPRRASE